MAISDVTITIDAVAQVFEFQQLDGMRCVRHDEPSSNVEDDLVISHEVTATGITRSTAGVEERFLNDSVEEMAKAYVVLTYKSSAGKARALAIGKGLLAWLTATSNANLTSLSQKGYGS